MNAVDNFVKNNEFGYGVSKTLVNKLIPIGKTRESLDRYGILNEDQLRADKSFKVKKIIDKVHKKFISDVLSGFDSDWTELYNAYKQNEIDKDTKKLKLIQDKFRKQISDKFMSDSIYKKLFTDDLYNELLPPLCNGEELDDIYYFEGFHGYFTNFNVIRKNLYISEEKHNTVAYRIINENFPVFYENKKLFDKIVSNTPDVLNSDYFNELKNIFVNIKFPVSNEDIEKFNLFISGKYEEGKCITKGLNQTIKEYRDKNKVFIPYFTELHLNILSEKTPLFTVEKFNETSELLEEIKSYNEFFSIFIKEFNVLNIPELDSIYVSARKLNYLSQTVTGDYSLYKKIICSYESKMKDFYSFKEIDELCKKYIIDNELDRNEIAPIVKYFDIILNYNQNDMATLYREIEFDKIQDVQSDKSKAIPIKNYLQKILDLYNLLRYIYLPTENAKINENYYTFLENNLEKLSCIVPLYNKARNFITKKLSDEKKIKLNFDCVTLLAGWDINKEYTNNSLIFMDDSNGKYYLAIFNPAQTKPRFKEVQDSDFKKMYMKYIPSPNKMLPHIVFSKKGIETFKPSEELMIKYKMGLYKKGPDFNIDFCHELIDFFKNCIANYENYNVFNFKFKETKDYKDISEFYKDVSDCGYKLEMRGISKEEVFAAVDNEELFLFEIYNRHLCGHSRGKDVHTEIFKALFASDNDSIQICGGAEIYYRRPLIEKKITHKAGSYVLNKNTKEGLSIDSDIYKNIYEHLNFGKNLSSDAKTLLDSGRVVYKRTKRELIKNKRFTEENFTFHLPVVLNYKSKNMFTKQFNDRVIETIKNEDVNILAINRGEHNLISAVLMNKKGEVLNRQNFNFVYNQNSKVDFKEKLYKCEIERKKSRLDWQDIDNIAELKEGYLSNVISQISKMMIENNAILILEDLSSDFVHSRAKIERNVYQKFQTNLLRKLSCLILKDAKKDESGSIYHPYQLVPDVTEYKSNYMQFGWVFFMNAAYISKICHEEAYVNVFDLNDITNFKNRVDFISKFESIKKTDEGYEFTFKRKKFNELFDGEDTLVCNGKWNVWNKKEKKFEEIDVDDTMRKAFIMLDCTESGINYLDKIRKLEHNLVNNSALELIISCFKICSEKKNYINNEWKYNFNSWDYIASENLALKMICIISRNMNLSKNNSVQNIKNNDYIKWLEEKNKEC